MAQFPNFSWGLKLKLLSPSYNLIAKRKKGTNDPKSLLLMTTVSIKVGALFTVRDHRSLPSPAVAAVSEMTYLSYHGADLLQKWRLSAQRQAHRVPP